MLKEIKYLNRLLNIAYSWSEDIAIKMAIVPKLIHFQVSIIELN